MSVSFGQMTILKFGTEESAKNAVKNFKPDGKLTVNQKEVTYIPSKDLKEIHDIATLKANAWSSLIELSQKEKNHIWFTCYNQCLEDARANAKVIDMQI